MSIITLDADIEHDKGKEHTLQQQIGETLKRHYPGYLWAVQVDILGGVVNIYNLTLTGRWGFVVHIKNIDSRMKKIVDAGGEMLERYFMPRDRLMNSEQVRDKVMTADRDFMKELKLDAERKSR